MALPIVSSGVSNTAARVQATVNSDNPGKGTLKITYSNNEEREYDFSLFDDADLNGNGPRIAITKNVVEKVARYVLNQINNQPIDSAEIGLDGLRVEDFTQEVAEFNSDREIDDFEREIDVSGQVKYTESGNAKTKEFEGKWQLSALLDGGVELPLLTSAAPTSSSPHQAVVIPLYLPSSPSAESLAQSTSSAQDPSFIVEETTAEQSSASSISSTPTQIVQPEVIVGAASTATSASSTSGSSEASETSTNTTSASTSETKTDEPIVINDSTLNTSSTTIESAVSNSTSDVTQTGTGTFETIIAVPLVSISESQEILPEVLLQSNSLGALETLPVTNFSMSDDASISSIPSTSDSSPTQQATFSESNILLNPLVVSSPSTVESTATSNSTLSTPSASGLFVQPEVIAVVAELPAPSVSSPPTPSPTTAPTSEHTARSTSTSNPSETVSSIVTKPALELAKKTDNQGKLTLRITPRKTQSASADALSPASPKVETSTPVQPMLPAALNDVSALTLRDAIKTGNILADDELDLILNFNKPISNENRAELLSKSITNAMEIKATEVSLKKSKDKLANLNCQREVLQQEKNRVEEEKKALDSEESIEKALIDERERLTETIAQLEKGLNADKPKNSIVRKPPTAAAPAIAAPAIAAPAIAAPAIAAPAPPPAPTTVPGVEDLERMIATNKKEIESISSQLNTMSVKKRELNSKFVETTNKCDNANNEVEKEKEAHEILTTRLGVANARKTSVEDAVKALKIGPTKTASEETKKDFENEFFKKLTDFFSDNRNNTLCSMITPTGDLAKSYQTQWSALNSEFEDNPGSPTLGVKARVLLQKYLGDFKETCKDEPSGKGSVGS